MKVKCSYCGNYISDTEEKCPNCMAPNDQLKRVGNEVPQTIEELKNWYVEHNLPPEETTRFFIGKDIREPRAFGIYYEESSGNYIVYKNKDTGQRAVRYEGKDEAYAVNELYLKLKEEILHQKSLNQETNSKLIKTSASRPSYWTRGKGITAICLFLAIFLRLMIPVFFKLVSYDNNYYSSGYYVYENQPFYLYDYCRIDHSDECEWYYYNPDTSEWFVAYDVNLEEMEYVGYDWNNHLGIDITKKLQDEDWFKELHPPTPAQGYYQYNNQIYYYFHGWYIYQNNTWSQSSAPNHDVELNPDNYYDSTTTSSDTYSFKDSSYYDNYYTSNSYDNDSSWSSSSNDDWDSGSSWDSNDSWDSGSTDWGSDW